MLVNNAIDLQRVAAVVHYVIAKADPGKLGHVKLNTILWYSDLEHYRRHGASMTGLREYSRMPQGPMAQDIFRAVGRLVKKGKVAEPAVKIADYIRREMNSLEPPDVSALTQEQIGILDRMIKIVAPLTANQLNQMTHDDPLWQELKNDAPMSIATGSIITRLPTSK